MTKNRLEPSVRRPLLVLLILLVANGAALAVEAAPERGTVSGCVERANHATYRGVAALWPALPGKAPDPRRAIRPPAVSTSLNNDGCFVLQAKPGDYFVGAVVRLTEGGWQGPPRPGDMVFLSPDAAGKNEVVTVRPGETTDVGRHTLGWPYAGFSPANAQLSISGRLTDKDGKPLSGLLVFAFTDSTMSKEPLAVSEPSDSSGRYLLRLPEPAIVYLRVRENYGRRNPLDGGYMGVYGGASPQPVSVGAAGDNQTRDLEVFLIPSRRNSPESAPTPFSPPENKLDRTH